MRVVRVTIRGSKVLITQFHATPAGENPDVACRSGNPVTRKPRIDFVDGLAIVFESQLTGATCGAPSTTSNRFVDDHVFRIDGTQPAARSGRRVGRCDRRARTGWMQPAA